MLLVKELNSIADNNTNLEFEQIVIIFTVLQKRQRYFETSVM